MCSKRFIFAFFPENVLALYDVQMAEITSHWQLCQSDARSILGEQLTWEMNKFSVLQEVPFLYNRGAACAVQLKMWINQW